jgi:hypothetical protein
MRSRYFFLFMLLVNVFSKIILAASSSSFSSVSSSAAAAAATAQASEKTKISLTTPFSCFVQVQKLSSNWFTCNEFDSGQMQGSYEGVVRRLLQSVEALVSPGTPPGSPRTGKPMNAYNARNNQKPKRLQIKRRSHLADGLFYNEDSLEIEVAENDVDKKWFKQAQAFLTDKAFLAQHPAMAKKAGEKVVSPFVGKLTPIAQTTQMASSASPAAGVVAANS